ncbi:MAG: hypothetical protein QNJ14_04305 [Woeseiaceae bacterium]|nr:hypothetical protein [Woeseiaceae bacterium]
MKKMTLVIILLSLSLAAGRASAVESIKVLVVRGPGVNAVTALGRLNELNELMSLSGLASYDFENAGDHVGAPGLTQPSTCSMTTANALIACLMYDDPDPDVFDIPAARTLYDADIVLMVVPFVSAATCGVTPSGMTNLPSITPNNRQYGYAAVGLACNVPGTFYTASHEILHLLSIEHKLFDPELDDPVRDNHAYTSIRQATAAAAPGDCLPNPCNSAVNQMSDPNDEFPNGNDMGSSTHANAKRVVRDLSWNAVAAYKPVPLPEDCVLTVTQWCNNDSPQASATPTVPGFTMTGIDVEYTLSGSNNWYPVYEGNPTCPIYNPPSTFMNIVRATVEIVGAHVLECTVQVFPIWCGSGDPL